MKLLFWSKHILAMLPAFAVFVFFYRCLQDYRRELLIFNCWYIPVKARARIIRP